MFKYVHSPEVPGRDSFTPTYRLATIGIDGKKPSKCYGVIWASDHVLSGHSCEFPSNPAVPTGRSFGDDCEATILDESA